MALFVDVFAFVIHFRIPLTKQVSSIRNLNGKQTITEWVGMEEIGLVFVGIAILIVIVISTSTIEKSLKSIEKQNDMVIELLKENRDKH